MAAGDLHLTNANVRDFSDALALRRHSELRNKRKKTYKKKGKKSGYGHTYTHDTQWRDFFFAVNMNNLGLNNIPIPQDLSVFVVQDLYFPSLFVGVFC